MTVPGFVLLTSSCLCAFCVNWSMVLVNGKASALTYSLLGYFKTIAILTAGALVFNHALSLRMIFGAGGAMAMLALYSKINLREQQLRDAAVRASDIEAGEGSGKLKAAGGGDTETGKEREGLLARAREGSDADSQAPRS